MNFYWMSWRANNTVSSTDLCAAPSANCSTVSPCPLQQERQLGAARLARAPSFAPNWTERALLNQTAPNRIRRISGGRHLRQPLRPFPCAELADEPASPAAAAASAPAPPPLSALGQVHISRSARGPAASGSSCNNQSGRRRQGAEVAGGARLEPARTN